MEITVDTFNYRGQSVKTVFINGRPDVPTTDALLRLQKGRHSTNSLAYYARYFLVFLNSINVGTLSDVTCAHMRQYSDHLNGLGYSAEVQEKCAEIVANIFDSFRELGGTVSPTLITGDSIYQLTAKTTRRGKHSTIAGNIILHHAPSKKTAGKDILPNYTKWLSDDDIAIVRRNLSVRDRCIFGISVETGYRISSVLSIPNQPDQFRSNIVEETFSKCGPVHQAKISSATQSDIVAYINGPRRRAVKKYGNDCGALFLTVAGRPLSYAAYRKNLQYAQDKIQANYPDKQGLVLHTHAGRSTFFNKLMRQNHAAKIAGKPYLSDQQIMTLMDWKTMDCLKAYYNFVENGLEPSVLWEDLFSD